MGLDPGTGKGEVLHIKRTDTFNSCGIQIDVAKVTVEWRVILLRILEFLGSNLRWELNYPE